MGILSWIVLGLVAISQYLVFLDYVANPDRTPPGLSPSDGVFLYTVLAALFITFAIIAFILAAVIRFTVLEPLWRQEYEMAARYTTVLGGLGLIFGAGAGGYFMIHCMRKMRETMTPKGKDADGVMVAEATPICPTCGGPVRFVHGLQRWHCDKCAKFL